MKKPVSRTYKDSCNRLHQSPAVPAVPLPGDPLHVLRSTIVIVYVDGRARFFVQ